MANITPKQEVEKLKAEKKRNKLEAKRVMQQVGGDAGAMTVHALTKVAMTKMPRLQSFDKEGKVRTRAVLSIPLYIGGVLGGDDAVAIGARDLGLVWMGVESERFIERQTWAQPSPSP